MTARSAFLLTALAMVFFAANSVLGRWALADGEAGPAAFALLRLLSGAICLGLLVRARGGTLTGGWRPALALLGYVVFFTYAYLALPAGLGALILFVMVQMTMLGAGLLSGERPSVRMSAGAAVALAGLVALLAPGQVSAPLWAALTMAAAGICWGVYSVFGRSAGDPTRATAGNFARASLLAVILLAPPVLLGEEVGFSQKGFWLAVISGAVTSGLGYAIWYRALPGLSAIGAGTAQLSVPAIAALGGALLLGEALSSFELVMGLIILGGVALATLPKRKAG